MMCFERKVKSLRIFDSKSISSSSSCSFTSCSFTPQRFDVFVNYRGADTRKNFVSFLYKELVSKGIRTFKDDKELERGRLISPEILQAIKGSKFAIVVVSATYAASPWCLEELVKIVDRGQKGLLTVLPIFYEIDPSDVRRQIGQVAKQFKKHDKRHSREKVKSWRNALTRLADISGECSRNWEDDCKLVDEISERVANTLHGDILDGIDEHMSKLCPMLGLDSKEGVEVIGILGRGSNGRSALARHVYEDISDHFDAHCFLGNVGRMSLHCRLQEELLSKMQGECLNLKSSYRCLKAMKARLRNKKILIVANNVDEIEQLDAIAEEFSWFGPGSRIIIATQDMQLLNSLVVKSVYKVDLFRSLAFKQIDKSLEQIDVSFDPSTYGAFNLDGDVFSTLKYLVAMLCGTVVVVSLLRERINSLGYNL